MNLRSLIVGAGLVATTNALLLPRDIPIADDSITTLPMPTDVDVDMAISKVPESQTLDLECPGCLGYDRKHGQEIPSHLKLDFRVESTIGADRLTVNGYELYPDPDLLGETLMAPLLPDMASRHNGATPRLRGGMDRPQKNQRLGFAMETETVSTKDDQDLQLLNVEIQIIEVGDVFVESIPNVQVKLVKTPSGKLAIGTIDTIPFQAHGSADGKQECSTRVCRWKAMFFENLARIFSFKGCGGSAHAHQGHHHHMGHKHISAHGLLSTIFTHILLPILIGVVAGVSVSIIGMLTGTLIVFLWRTFVRRPSARSSHRCRYAHKASRNEHAADGEKSGLLGAQEDVEAPPAYVASNATEAGDKKAEDQA